MVNFTALDFENQAMILIYIISNFNFMKFFNVPVTHGLS